MTIGKQPINPEVDYYTCDHCGYCSSIVQEFTRVAITKQQGPDHIHLCTSCRTLQMKCIAQAQEIRRLLDTAQTQAAELLKTMVALEEYIGPSFSEGVAQFELLSLDVGGTEVLQSFFENARAMRGLEIDASRITDSVRHQVFELDQLAAVDWAGVFGG